MTILKVGESEPYTWEQKNCDPSACFHQHLRKFLQSHLKQENFYQKWKHPEILSIMLYSVQLSQLGHVAAKSSTSLKGRSREGSNKKRWSN